jgi:hypothetical protein
LHQSATWHCTVNTHCIYMNAFLTLYFRSICDVWQNGAMCLHQVLREAQ